MDQVVKLKNCGEKNMFSGKVMANSQSSFINGIKVEN